METPDRWVIIKVTKDGKTNFKVLAGWSGSYLDGQSWRINSGIKQIQTEDDHYLFHGYSGSIYKCHKNGYGMNMIMGGIAERISQVEGVSVLKEEDFKRHLLGE
jgi:hypothetical protein